MFWLTNNMTVFKRRESESDKVDFVYDKSLYLITFSVN